MASPQERSRVGAPLTGGGPRGNGPRGRSIRPVALLVLRPLSLTRPPAQLDDPLVQIEATAQLGGFEGAVLSEGQPQPSRHLHLTKPHLGPVSRKVLNDDREHGPG